MGIGATRITPMTDIIPAISLGAFRARSVGLDIPTKRVPIDEWMRYGDRYAQGYTLFEEYEESSVRHMQRVAKAIPFVRRRTGVSWSSHAEIASRPQEEQEQWLDELEMGMTRAELRLSLDGRDPVEKAHCPTCGTLVDKGKIG